MEKMWAGRFSKPLEDATNDFNSSIKTDSAMYMEDIKGSIAHATMLGRQNIIPLEDSKKIVEELFNILSDIESKKLIIDPNAEDIHMFVEEVLTKRIGDLGKKLHTARSRNDQVALDTRLYLREKIDEISLELTKFLKVLVKMADLNLDTIMSGYTHLQMAQPITLAHYLMAYASMFMRDKDRLSECKKRINILPLGSLALAGTTYNIDREMVAKELGFESVCINSIDGVSDRDFCIELASDISIIMMHLSRFSEEIILWCSQEFKYLELDDGYATGSSIMPQKKNPDIAELVRGKTGRTYGNLMALLTMMKALPLAYNKDMQEDKESIFDSVNTVLMCLPIFADMLSTAKVLKENMRKKAEYGYINATDSADYLTAKGLPFRTSYKITGELVAYAIAGGKALKDLSLAEFKKFSELFEEDIYKIIDLASCVDRRKSQGGTAKSSVKNQIEIVKKYLEVEDND